MRKTLATTVATCALALVLLSGCKGNDYKKAQELYENGSYEEAAEIFQGLGDYEDSAQMADTCTYEAAKARYDAGDYEGALTLFQAVSTYEDAQERIADTQHQIMLETYAEPIARLSKRSWFFNGGSDSSVNRISFSEDAATIHQIYYDGNGKHDGGSNDFPYVIDDDNITLTLAGGTTQTIPYTLTKKGIKIDSGEYLTKKQVERGLQGHWTLRQSSYLLGKKLENEYHILVRDGRMTFESAAKALNGGPGEYYYFGPYEGTYDLSDTGLDSEIHSSIGWGFNVIDGRATMMYFDHPMTKVDSDAFPGQNGYSF